MTQEHYWGINKWGAHLLHDLGQSAAPRSFACSWCSMAVGLLSSNEVGTHGELLSKVGLVLQEEVDGRQP